MSNPEPAPFPAPADVARYGNLLLSFWSPPDSKASATANHRAAVQHLAARALTTLLAGYRPGKWSAALQGSVPAQLKTLSTPADVPTDWQAIAGPFPAALLGIVENGVLRHRAPDVTGGRPTVVATPLLIVPLAAISASFGSVCIRGDVHHMVSIIRNPLAGLRQRESGEIVALAQSLTDRAIVGWGTNSLCVMSAPASLLALLASMEADRQTAD